MNTKQKIQRNFISLQLGTAIVLLATAACAFSTSASAETHWQQTHGWRVHDNHRIANQNHRITQEVKEGEMTHQQAHTLRQDDHDTRLEEREMAAQDKGGHLTRADQHALNQQLNENSQDIGK